MRLRLVCQALAILSGCCLISHGVARADEQPLVRVLPQVDAGGLEAFTHDGKTLAARLTEGLRGYLESHAEGRLRTVEGSDETTPANFCLQGDISFSAARFRWNLHLFRGASASSLAQIAEWHGSARQERQLSANLARDERYSSEGLLGELGSRAIVAILTNTPAGLTGEWGRFVQGVKFDLPAERTTAHASRDLVNLYSFKVAPVQSGDLYIVAPFAGGQSLQPAELSKGSQPVDLTAGKPVTVDFYFAGRAPTESPSQIYMLLRRRRNPVREVGPTGPAANPRALWAYSRSKIRAVPPPPVEVEDTPTESASVVLTSVLSRAQGDPAGLWHGNRIDLAK